MEKLNYRMNPEDVSQCKYKVNPAIYETAYYDAGIMFDGYSKKVAMEFDDFYTEWYCGYYPPDGYMYINDIDELIFDKLTDEDKEKIRNYLKKIVIKL